MFCGLPVMVASSRCWTPSPRPAGTAPVAAQAERDFEHQRREHQAHRVVDEERGEHAGDQHDTRQQQHGPCACSHHPGADQREEAGEAQIGDHDHHAEQQDDGVEVDGLVGLLKRDDAEGHHQAGADERHAGAVDRQPRHLADRQRQVAGGEDRQRRRGGAPPRLRRASARAAPRCRAPADSSSPTAVRLASTHQRPVIQ